ALRDPMRALHVAGLHPRGKPINHVVTDTYRVFLVTEADHASDGTEYLLLRNLHPIGHLREHRGLVIEPVGELGVLGAPAAAEELRPLALANLDIPLDFV